MHRVPLDGQILQPVLSRRDTRSALQWRIRNLPYPLEVYNITAEGGNIVVRTTNKKYGLATALPASHYPVPDAGMTPL